MGYAQVCTKVASYLEQGQRLENLSWRLWHLQNLMVDTDNAKSKREFKKLSKCMGDKLDKEKGRSIEELEAPDFKRNHSTDLLRQRAVEKERNREASHNAQPGTIKRMQFTFSVDAPAPSPWNANTNVTKPDTKPSSEFKGHSNKRSRAVVRAEEEAEAEAQAAAATGMDEVHHEHSLTTRGRRPSSNIPINRTDNGALIFPSLFSNDFHPAALLYPAPTHTNRMTYGEGVGGAPSAGFSISRPTIELPLDDILNGVEHSENSDMWASPYMSNNSEVPPPTEQQQVHIAPAAPQQDISMEPVAEASSSSSYGDSDSEDDADDESYVSTPVFNMVPPPSQSARELLPQTISPAIIAPPTPRARTKTPMGRPTLTVKTDAKRGSSALGATATSVNPALLRQGGTTNNPPPTGGKAECSNCGATHTPLWRRGLNDELNCNACGLYCKLHKRPRPKSMRATHGEGRQQAAPRPETVDVMAVRPAQCYNCHTTATPLWRKDDEGKTVCNACGLYYKLHGASRPISMKSDVIRKRSRHDARRAGHSGATNASDTPSVSRSGSPNNSPHMERSPTLAPDSTTQMAYEFSDDSDFHTSQSELMGALGNTTQNNFSGIYSAFPGPYHPDYLSQQAGTTPSDALPFAAAEITSESEKEEQEQSRTSKRRRMSTDSASEPPSSAVSFSSYNDGYSSQSSATSHSQRSSMDFPFNSYPAYNMLRGSGSTFWHPPMMLPTDDSPMDYIHPPMLPQEEENLFNQYLHPPMVPPADEGKGAMGAMPVYNTNGTTNGEFYDSQMHHF
ncbi:hypothetical protein HWV62_11604 [Athelia sp. TMB]|nr:hypothetical protein HWV62_11604 [Athelia sp. TMB]